MTSTNTQVLFRGQIKDAAPNGSDVYFDNVGGEMLDMVLALMNAKGRIPVCGVLSQYNAEDEYYGVTNTRLIFDKQLRLQGVPQQRIPRPVGPGPGRAGKSGGVGKAQIPGNRRPGA